MRNTGAESISAELDVSLRSDVLRARTASLTGRMWRGMGVACLLFTGCASMQEATDKPDTDYIGQSESNGLQTPEQYSSDRAPHITLEERDSYSEESDLLTLEQYNNDLPPHITLEVQTYPEGPGLLTLEQYNNDLPHITLGDSKQQYPED